MDCQPDSQSMSLTEFGFVIVFLGYSFAPFEFIQDLLCLLDLLRRGQQVSAAKNHQILVD
jgi:hypothetical protein